MMFRSRQLFLLVVIATLLLATPALAAGSGPSEYTIPGDAVFPEGIAFQPATGHFYVGSTTDGTIYRGHVKDEAMEVFLPGNEDGRTFAAGLDVHRDGALFISGGSTGQMFVYDTETGELLAQFSSNAENTFINDVTVTRRGDAFFTDSFDPVIYRVFLDDTGEYQMETWLELSGTAVEYQEGFNLNGVVITRNNRYLIAVQTNTGQLFRIDIDDQEIQEISLDSEALTNGDGILLLGHNLYVVRNQMDQIAKVRLSGDYLSGSTVSTITDPSLSFPTTLALARGRLLVVNSQFDLPENPELPFTVSSLRSSQ